MSLNKGIRLNGSADPQIAAFDAAQAHHHPADGAIVEPRPQQKTKKRKRRRTKTNGTITEKKMETRSGKDVLALQKFIGENTKGKLTGETHKTYLYKVISIGAQQQVQSIMIASDM